MPVLSGLCCAAVSPCFPRCSISASSRLRAWAWSASAVLNAWGCEVTAFTTSEAKYEEAKTLGTHQVVLSRKPEAMKAVAGGWI